MPNHCNNTLIVTGPDDDITAFVEANGKSPLSFEAFLPTPPESLEDEGGNGVMPAWWTWRVEHWGTKWDAYDHGETYRQPGRYEVPFDTAWSPPEPFVAAVSKRFPALTFVLAYDEPGMDFGGYVVYRNGEEVDKLSGLSAAITWFERAEGAL